MKYSIKILISGGNERCFLPLYISINKPIKKKMRNGYTKYCLEQNNNYEKVSKVDIIGWIRVNRYDHNISVEIICKSFQ